VFDLGQTGKVHDMEIRDVYHNFGVYITLEDAKLIMSRYDNDYDQRLSYFEFIEMVLPKDKSSSNILAERSDRYLDGYYSTPGFQNRTTYEDFSKVLALNAKVENHAEEIRQLHNSSLCFSKQTAFDSLNAFGDFSITKEDFARLLADHRFFATDGELNTLIDRFDKTKDGRVTYEEFASEITPHSPKRY